MPEEIRPEKKPTDLAEEWVATEGIEADEELLLARDLVSFFLKTFKAIRFYPPDNPTIKGFKEQLSKKFQHFLGRYPTFVLQIDEYSLLFKERVLYENRDPKSSFAFLFYKDGLRELRFMKGLEEWEIEGLLEVIRTSDQINEMEDDLVTLLWERDFPHISYLATDEFLEETPILIPENGEQLRRGLVFKPLAYNVQVDLLDEEGQDLERLLAKSASALSLKDRVVYQLTPEEIERLQGEVTQELDPAFVFEGADILFEILNLEQDRGPYQQAAHLLMKNLDGLITLGEFNRASELLRRLYHMVKSYGLKDWQVEILHQFLEKAGDEERIERIGNLLEKEVPLRLEEVSEYLALLQQNAIKPLIHLLGRLKNSKARRMVCDALSEIGKNAIELFAPFIEDRRWYLVRNITYILGRIGKEKGLLHVQKAFNHEDVRVRREAVQALGLIGGPKAVSLLIKALTDKDARIRAMAALNLGKMGKNVGLAALLEVVQSKDFQKRDSAEIKAFLDAVGLVGSNEAIPVLQQMLERKSLFGLGLKDEIRLGVANTLAMIGTPEAKAVLERGMHSKEEAIRTACQQALRKLSSKEQTA
ncbi:MAG: HEAT repeat domain-containing protein [Desulfobacterota bacterium]|nr:HEAT repeat domain-containing protein [Thermodesulfobacteriota bacterium]